MCCHSLCCQASDALLNALTLTLCQASDALLNAIKDRAAELEEQLGDGVAAALFDMPKSELQVVVTKQHLDEALSKITPSLTMAQVEEYNSQR